ncbi:MAG: hypothetical protein KME31_13640 [Tolypothrix carrinoi HA7290-LM1]|nr:hypothetical protein [Tolypothrix carrinoi HA7290-LM1]
MVIGHGALGMGYWELFLLPITHYPNSRARAGTPGNPPFLAGLTITHYPNSRARAGTPGNPPFLAGLTIPHYPFAITHSPLPIPPTLEPEPALLETLPFSLDSPFPIPHAHSPVILNKLLKLLHLRV